MIRILFGLKNKVFTRTFVSAGIILLIVALLGGFLYQKNAQFEANKVNDLSPEPISDPKFSGNILGEENLVEGSGPVNNVPVDSKLPVAEDKAVGQKVSADEKISQDKPAEKPSKTPNLSLVPPAVVTAQPVSWPPVLPSGPLPGAKTGEGYPEKRSYISAQWHDSESKNIDNMRHMHVETAVPDAVRTPILRLDVFARVFHFQGGTFEGVRKVVVRTNTPVKKVMPIYFEDGDQGRRQEVIPQGEAGHNLEYWTPVLINLSSVTEPDWYTFEIDTTVRRPDGHRAQARLIWKMYVDIYGNSEAVKVSSQRPAVLGEGWVSPKKNESNQFGYLSITMYGSRRYQSDPATPITLVPRARNGRRVNLMLVKNPDLHQHPANYGEVIYNETFTMGDRAFEKIVVPPPAMVAGDRLMARIVDAEDPDLGSAATLVVTRMSAD